LEEGLVVPEGGLADDVVGGVGFTRSSSTFVEILCKLRDILFISDIHSKYLLCVCATSVVVCDNTFELARDRSRTLVTSELMRSIEVDNSVKRVCWLSI
jgi:hypothetical protein